MAYSECITILLDLKGSVKIGKVMDRYVAVAYMLRQTSATRFWKTKDSTLKAKVLMSIAWEK